MRKIDFNALPRASRERFIEAVKPGAATWGGPIFRQQGTTGAVVGWVLLMLAAAGVLWFVMRAGFGWYFSPWQSVTYAAWYVGGFVVMALGLVGLVRRAFLSKGLPYSPGLFVFPLDFVVAKTHELEIIPMTSMLNLQPVHHYRNGIYTHTMFHFTFPGRSFSLSVPSREFAEQSLGRLRQAQHTIADALDKNDAATIMALDPFCDARMRDWQPANEPGPTAKGLPGWMKAAWLVAIPIGLVLGLPTYLVRNWLSDEKAYAEARASGEDYQLESYARTGRHGDEVRRDALPRARLRKAKQTNTIAGYEAFLAQNPSSVVDADAKSALAEAVHRDFLGKKTVTELRGFVTDRPNAPDVPAAKAKIHALYQKSLSDFRARANAGDPNVVPVMESVIQYMEANESPPLEVRFRRRSSPSLAAADKLLSAGALDDGPTSKNGGRAEVSKHFDEAHAKPREEAVVHALENAFRGVFPADILPLKRGLPMEGDAAPATKASSASANGKKSAAPAVADPSVTKPTIFVDYETSWSGSTYVGRDSGRRFVGIAVKFDVAVKTPNQPRVLDFTMKVEPPQSFTVDYTTWDPSFRSARTTSTTRSTGGPSDDEVYDTMALRAFDQMSTKLKGVFFGGYGTTTASAGHSMQRR